MTIDTLAQGQQHAGPYTFDMAKRRIMGVQEARQNFAAVVAAAANDGEQTILFRRSTPSAVVVPAAWFHRAAELMGEPWEDWEPPTKPDTPFERAVRTAIEKVDGAGAD